MWLVSRLIWGGRYREDLKDRLTEISLEFSDQCKRQLADAVADLLSQLEEYGQRILARVRGQIEDRIHDLEDVRAARSKEHNELCEKRDALVADSRTLQTIREAAAELEERFNRLGESVQ